ncbi:MAG: sulfatase-like hydrolase/transferase [Verrucomicrobia bacterium]|nr:sulfatase-like hydrolase/transferase [Verrucomicrobiota bacterium]
MGFLSKILAWCTSKQEFNYLYFLFFLATVSLLSLSYFLKQENPVYGIQIFFIFYTLGQSLLEVGFFMLISCFLKRWAPAWVFKLFIGISFLALLAHYVDFTLLRLMDTSFSYVYKFFFGSGLSHLLTAFLALNMNATMIGIIFSGIAAVPLIGIGFYWLTQAWIRHKPWSLSFKQMAIALAAIGISLFFLDLFAYPYLNRLAYNKYQKALPLGTTFISPASQSYPLLKAPLKAEPTDLTVLPSATPLPNIYFFIIETLRRDFIEPDIAPNMAAFGQENISFPHSYANANYTMLSWFALLHGGFPHRWTEARDQWKEGSVPLRILKKLGYKIKVFSAADMSYFNIDKVLFGSERQLLDQIEEYTALRHLEPCDRDALAVDACLKQLDENKNGTAYFFFLDSTHSEYSFPKDFPLKFEPISKEISYLTIGKTSGDLNLLKNKYKNSIAYVDSLAGKFLTALKEKNLYTESIIIFTGDHGEEFFEEGALFHGTHLNQYQTSVPILCKMNQNHWKIDPKRDIISHVDIFPTIIHSLTRSTAYSDLFDGTSIYQEKKWPYHLSVLQNGSEPPVEFTIERGGDKIIGRFINSTSIEILEPEAASLHELIQERFPGAFDPLTK